MEELQISRQRNPDGTLQDQQVSSTFLFVKKREEVGESRGFLGNVVNDFVVRGGTTKKSE